MNKKMIRVICIISIMSILLTGCCLSHDWQEATCTTPKTCAKCGEIKGEASGHDWQEATCTEAKTCSVCGETEGEALGHTVTGEATCTEPAICSVCGETVIEALGHNWQEATCLTPKTCSACGETEGDIGDHVWADATCLAPRTCTVCGETEGEIASHNFNGSGICTVCGISQKVELTLDNVNDFFTVTYSVEKDVLYTAQNGFSFAGSPRSCYTSTRHEGANWYTITITPTSDDFVIDGAAAVSLAAKYTKDNGETHVVKYDGAIRLETGDQPTICEYDFCGSYSLDAIVIRHVNGYCIIK